jgi:hypothetical protein
MPWLKLGDDAATHPIVMRVADRGAMAIDSLNAWERATLVFGMVVRCAGQSAAHLTDHFVSVGTIMTMVGPEWERWAKEAARAGYWTKARVDGQPGYKIVAVEEFIHIRLKAEVEWERQQRNDTRNPDLTMPVRQRDGDGCRYCGVVVQWNARRGARAGTYDHVDPGKPAITVDDLVVACKACNSGRKDAATEEARANYQLRPVPRRPIYSAGTLAQLVKHGLTPRPGFQPDNAPATPHTEHDPSRPGFQPDNASSDLAAGQTTPTPVSAENLTDRAGSAGSGRDGPGQVGPGLVGPGQVGSGPRSPRKRASRSRRTAGSRDP